MKKFILLLLIFNTAFSQNSKITEFKSNGVKTWFVERHNLPIVDVKVIFDAGAINDQNLRGVASLTNKNLLLICADKSRQQVTRAFESQGAEYGKDFGYDWSDVYLRVLSDKEHLNPALNMFASCLGKAKFSNKLLNKSKQKVIASWQELQKEPVKQAILAIKKQYYGGHAYGLPAEYSAKEVAKVNVNSLVRFYQKNYTKNSAHLIIVGDLDLAKARIIADKLTKSLPVGSKRLHALLKHNVAVSKKLKFASQAQITTVIGFPGVALSNDDRLKFLISNYPFGGYYGRLIDRLREKNGYVYAANSYVVPRRLSGEFYIIFRSRPEVSSAAKDLALKEFKNYLSQGPSEDEVSNAKKHFLQNLFRKRSSNEGVMSELTDLYVSGLSLSEFDEVPKKIAAFNRDDLKKVFARILSVQNPTVVTVSE